MGNSNPQPSLASAGDIPKGYVYILTNRYNKLLYIGATNDLARRITEHRLKIIKGFTSKYNINKLVYYEELASIENAFSREKQLKKYIRQYKLNLIQEFNPCWIDLYNNIVGDNYNLGDPRDALSAHED